MKYKDNNDYFKTWTNNSAYIIGFLMADGYIKYYKYSSILKGNIYVNSSRI